jgi:hypothetical protein
MKTNGSVVLANVPNLEKINKKIKMESRSNRLPPVYSYLPEELVAITALQQ